MSSESKQLSVCVATLTRQRPAMLGNLLNSWKDLIIPQNTVVKFLVIENDQKEHSKSVLNLFSENKQPFDALYFLEKEIGIPFARNRAAREAIKLKSDLLLFVDDDEIVAPDWLKQMILTYQNSNALLVGGPLRCQPPKHKLTFFQKLMYKNIEARYRRKEFRANGGRFLTKKNKTTIVTNNWLADITLFTKHNIWFDETMRHTGGTDAKFFSEVITKNLKTKWAKEAVVYETIPTDRLTFSYQYYRARDQYNTYVLRKNRTLVKKLLLLPTTLIIKFLLVLMLFLSVPLSGGRTLVTLARALGSITGHLRALVGVKSSHYMKTTGN